MGITRNRIPFDVWVWQEELKVLALEDFAFSKYLFCHTKNRNFASELYNFSRSRSESFENVRKLSVKGTVWNI